VSPGLARAIATFGYVGCIPGAPGTWGSLAALPLGYGLHWLGGFPLLALATLVVFALGLRATTAATRGQPDHDPSEIVIDEVAGQWIALMPLSLGLWLAGAAPHVFPWPGWVGAFVLFRAFDILKPWPVSLADRRPDALGVMLDDVLAGLYAAGCMTLMAAVAHGWLA
jgi:phosphatidylglycerophosphatase A